MSGEFKESTGKVSREEFSAELGEVALYCDTRDCVKTHSVERRNGGR